MIETSPESEWANPPYGVVLTPDGRHVAGVVAGKAVFWDVATGEVRASSPWRRGALERVALGVLAPGSEERPAFDLGNRRPDAALAFSTDGTRLACDGEMIDVASGAILARARLTPGSTYPVPSALAFSADGALLASASRDCEAWLWDAGLERCLATLEKPSLAPRDDWIVTLDFSPDGRTLAASTWLGQAVMWSVAGGRLAAVFPEDGPASVLEGRPDARVPPRSRV